MHIQGIQKLTLLDYPGHIACTLFSYGCNLRCPFCHNASLVTETPQKPINTEEITAFLQKRKGILDGICLSGGEPLMNPDALEFLKYLRGFGYKIKLDTNGFFPKQLEQAINQNLLDYVALDIKAPKESYAAATGISDIDVAPLCQSIEMIMNSGIDHEFRTTAVKGLHNVGDFEEIALWIKGAKRYYIQQFVSSPDLISHSFTSFSTEEMNEILADVQKIIPNALLRGI